MNTKKNENKPNATENKAEKTIPVRTDAEYTERSQRKGNPLLKANAAGRIYSNARANGTTATILAVLAASEVKPSADGIVDGAALAAGYAALRAGNYASPVWKRLEGIYGTIPGNRSASPALKLGPVVSALAREHREGYLRGFEVKKIGDDNLRAQLGTFTK